MQLKGGDLNCQVCYIASGTDREHGIGRPRMKSQDPTWTNGGESDALRRICGSRTKAGVSKVIRHRCSSSSKLCRQSVLLCDVDGRNLSFRALGIVRSQG